MARFFEPDEKLGGRDPQKFEEDIQGILEGEGFDTETVDAVMKIIDAAIEKRIAENEAVYPDEPPSLLTIDTEWLKRMADKEDGKPLSVGGIIYSDVAEEPWTKSDERMPWSSYDVNNSYAVRGVGIDGVKLLRSVHGHWGDKLWAGKDGNTFPIAGTEWRPVREG